MISFRANATEAIYNVANIQRLFKKCLDDRIIQGFENYSMVTQRMTTIYLTKLMLKAKVAKNQMQL